jgi:hypothetical protein
LQNSDFSSRINARIEILSSIERDKDGNFFIDHSFPVFELMVNNLRAKAWQPPHAPPVPPPAFTDLSTVTKLDFHRMLEYYGMVLAIYPVMMCVLCTHGRSTSNVEFGYDLGVKTNDWATFGIITKDHKLTIRLFEVTILKVERVQIGRRDPSSAFSIHSQDQKSGVGDMVGTVALDCCRSVILVNGPLHPFDGTCKEGSTIRCEDNGERCFIDGLLVASIDQSDRDVLGFKEIPFVRNTIGHTQRQLVPAISAEGSFYVSNVVYAYYEAARY